MARANLEVVTVMDPRGIERGAARSGRALDKFGKDADKSLGRARSGFGGLGRAAVGAGALLAGAGLVQGIQQIGQAAAESEKSNVRMEAQMRASGKSYDRYAGAIDKVIVKQSRLAAVDDEDLQDAFTGILRSTGSVTKSLDLLGVTSDLARGKQLGVAKAGEIVAKVAGGNTGVLGRYGIKIREGASATEALGVLQERFAGQAEKYGKSNAGALDRFDVASENLKESLGAGVLPLLARGAETASTFITQMERGVGAGGQFAATVTTIGTKAGDIAQLGYSFATSTEGAIILSAAVGGLGGRLAGLGIAAVVGQISGMATAARSAGGAMAALNLAVRANPIGLLATGIGLVVGGLIAYAGANRQAKVSADELTTAIDRQRDAQRRLVDLDLEATQRKANVKSANAQVAQSERELAAARAAGDPVRIKQAEAGLEQARLNAKRATRELSRTEEDATRVRRDARKATDEAVTATQGRLSTLTAERNKTRDLKNAIKDQIDAGKLNGATQEQLAPLQREYTRLKEKDAQQTRAIARATKDIPKEVRSKVIVKFSLSGVSGFLNDVGSAGAAAFDSPKGDGIGVAFRGAVSNVVGRAQSTFKKNVPRAAPVGSGSGLNAFNGVAGRFDVTPGSGLRPGATTVSGNTSYHALGYARDFNGSPGNLLRFFRYMKANYGSRLAELIYTPGGVGIKNGAPYRYTGKVAATHGDHVHVAMRPGGGQGDGEGANYVSTAYGPPWNAMNGTGVTANGTDLRPARKAYGIAVDPSKIKLGSSVYAWPNPFGYRGKFTAFDTGGAIKGNRVDFYDWRGRKSQNAWGRRAVKISRSSSVVGGAAAKKKKKGTPAITKVPGSAGGAFVTGQGISDGEVLNGFAPPDTSADQAAQTAQQLDPVSSAAHASLTAAGEASAAAYEAQTAGPSAQLALAGLTETKDDDLAALSLLEAIYGTRLAGAQAAGNNAGIIENANALKGVRDQMAALKESLDKNTTAQLAQAEAINALKDQRIAELQKRVRLGETTEGAIKGFFQDMVNAGIGGDVALGLLGISSPAGQGARY